MLMEHENVVLKHSPHHTPRGWLRSFFFPRWNIKVFVLERSSPRPPELDMMVRREYPLA